MMGLLGLKTLKKCDKCGELKETSEFSLAAGRFTPNYLCIELWLCENCTKSEVEFLKERFSGRIKLSQLPKGRGFTKTR